MLTAVDSVLSHCRACRLPLPTSGSVAQPPRGMIRVTRHPMLWSFAIWAAVHILGNGDTASIVFFGAILIAFILLSPEGISGIWIRLRGRRNWTLTAEDIPSPPKDLKGLLDLDLGPSAAGAAHR